MQDLPLKRQRLAHIGILLLFAATTHIYAADFRCDGSLVSEGDSKLSVINNCGEPSWIDRWTEETIDLPDTDFEHRIFRINERWVYNLGPRQFIRILTFKDGELYRIETGGRGFTAGTANMACDFGTLNLGSTSAKVESLCGEPDLEEQRYETFSRQVAGRIQQITVTVDEWTYNLGPTRFMRTLTFRNGDLVEIRTGEKGFVDDE